MVTENTKFLISYTFKLVKRSYLQIEHVGTVNLFHTACNISVFNQTNRTTPCS